MSYKLSQFGMEGGTMKLSFGNCSGNGFVTTRQMIQMDGTVVSTSQDLLFQEGNFVMNDVGATVDMLHRCTRKMLRWAIFGERPTTTAR